MKKIRIQGGPKPRTSELKHVPCKNGHINALLSHTSTLQFYQSLTQIEHFLLWLILRYWGTLFTYASVTFVAYSLKMLFLWRFRLLTIC